MGSKHASVHLRCEDSAEVLAKLKKEFRKKKGPSKKDLLAMEIIKAFAKKNISEISDPNEKAEKEAVQKRQVYEQQQNIKLVESYISRLDVMDTYDDTAEDIITKLQEALKKCEDYDTYDELNQKAEQAIERVRNLNSDTTTTESN